ncbi:MAG: hypothetical protein EA362_00370 [Saprospirales bacterium]|nr:MAG: hypothetical protein EA362_00370 [Saprospirales bacterium]
MKFTIFIVSFCLSISCAFSQPSIEYYSTSSNPFFQFVTSINEKPFFIANFKYSSSDNFRDESEIWTVDNEQLIQQLFITQVNDSLNHLFLFDFWSYQGEVIAFGYAENLIKNEKYIYFSKLDLITGEFYDITLFPFEDFRLIGYNQTVLNDQRNWFLLELEPDSSNRIALHRFTFEDGNYSRNRFELPEEVDVNFIRDVFFDFENDLIIVVASGTNRQFLLFDFEFNYISTQEPISLINGNPHKHVGTIIVGQKTKNFQIIERVRIQTQFVLHQRQMSFENEIFYINENYDEIQPYDSYLFRKYQTTDYSIMQYSRSTLNNFDDNFGFNLDYFNPSGKLIKSYAIDTEYPVGIDVVMIDEETGIGYGTGRRNILGVWDFFGFKLNLSDTTTSTEDIWQEASVPLLRSNLIIDGQLVFNDDELDLKRISVYGISGRQMIQGLSANGDISFLAAGHYILFYDGAEGVVTERFVKVE